MHENLTGSVGYSEKMDIPKKGATPIEEMIQRLNGQLDQLVDAHSALGIRISSVLESEDTSPSPEAMPGGGPVLLLELRLISERIEYQLMFIKSMRERVVL